MAEVPPVVSYDEFEDYRSRSSEDKVTIVDVRGAEELEALGSIPKTVNIPFNELDRALGSLSSEDFARAYGIEKPGLSDPIIFSCKSGVRSKKAEFVAKSHGFLKTSVYGGSYDEWSKRNLNQTD